MKNLKNTILKSLFCIAFIVLLSSCSVVKMARNANILFPPYSEIQPSFTAPQDSGISRISDTFHTYSLDSNLIGEIFNKKHVSGRNGLHKIKLLKSVLKKELRRAKNIDPDIVDDEDRKARKNQLLLIMTLTYVLSFLLFIIFVVAAISAGSLEILFFGSLFIRILSSIIIFKCLAEIANL